MLERYYNLFDPAKRYSELLFRAGDGLQSRELNEIQTTLKHQLKSVADALLKDGDIVQGCFMSVDPQTGAVFMSEGRVYLAGAVRDVASSTFTIPTSGIVAIGVRLATSVVTELEDPALREPAVGTRNYQEPGAGRIQETASWGWVGPDNSSDGGTAQFYPVYTVENAILQNKTRPPVFDGVTQMLARYDYDANGHYIVSGLGAKFVERDDVESKHVFLVASGLANVRGYKVEREQDQRLRLAIDPDLETVTAEPHVFSPGGDGKMVITLNRSPLSQVVRITATTEKTANVTHSAYSGGTDTLPDTTVVEVLEVKQGGTTYVVGSDYNVAGGAINWSPAGAEPAPGSSYSVTYRYIKTFSPEAVADTSLTVSGIVPGTIVQIDYTWKMPRVDAVAISQDGIIEVLKGVSVSRNPKPAPVPSDKLRLANIEYSWFIEQNPVVRNVGVRTVRTDDLAAMQSDIASLFGLIAREQLKNDLTIREPAAKKGIFVDPFLDNDMRDAGAQQNAAIFGGTMQAPIGAAVVGPYLSGQARHLPFVLESLLEQTARTGSMKVNPYAAILPMPATVTLNPSVDQWTQVVTQWTDAVTQTITQGSGNMASTSTATTQERVAAESQNVEFLRQIAVQFTAKGFGPSENVSALRFDGISLPAPGELTANASGVVSGSFTIPESIPAGQKLFEIEGSGGSYGTATFVGQGRILVETWRNRVTTTIQRWWWDPLAQTFAIDASRMIGGIDLWFTVKGDKDVLVQIRETSVGFPTRRVLAEGRIAATGIKTDGTATRITFDAPVWLEAGTEYAVCVLSDDTTHELAVAELGKWDSHNRRWVTSQPYQIGVLLSSSNASTWTAHQDKDLAFRLLGCRFTSTSQTVSLATNVDVSQMTDIMAMGVVERPASGCDVRFVATLDDGRKFTFGEFAGASLPDRFTGTMALTAELRGTTQASPVLAPDVQFIVGTMENEASYISRAVTAATTFSVQVVAEVLAPGTSSVAAFAEHNETDNFVAVDFERGEPVGDGWVEMTWKKTGLSGVGIDDTTRCKLGITNTPQYRAQVRNLRMIVT